jgi:hypothetical protein
MELLPFHQGIMKFKSKGFQKFRLKSFSSNKWNYYPFIKELRNSNQKDSKNSGSKVFLRIIPKIQAQKFFFE